MKRTKNAELRKYVVWWQNGDFYVIQNALREGTAFKEETEFWETELTNEDREVMELLDKAIEENVITFEEDTTLYRSIPCKGEDLELHHKGFSPWSKSKEWVTSADYGQAEITILIWRIKAGTTMKAIDINEYLEEKAEFPDQQEILFPRDQRVRILKERTKVEDGYYDTIYLKEVEVDEET